MSIISVYSTDSLSQITNSLTFNANYAIILTIMIAYMQGRSMT